MLPINCLDKNNFCTLSVYFQIDSDFTLLFSGQIEKRYPDGTVEITFPSKDIKYLFPDGGQEVILTDGTVMQYSSKGERTVEYPSGDREVHTAEYQASLFMWLLFVINVMVKVCNELHEEN